MKFDQDLCLNLQYDFGKMNSTLGSVVPLAMFVKIAIFSPQTPNISGNKSPNPQYFWQQILKLSIFLATNPRVLNISGNKLTSSANPRYFRQQIDHLYLQILNISDNKLTSSANPQYFWQQIDQLCRESSCEDGVTAFRCSQEEERRTGRNL